MHPQYDFILLQDGTIIPKKQIQSISMIDFEETDYISEYYFDIITFELVCEETFDDKVLNYHENYRQRFNEYGEAKKVYIELINILQNQPNSISTQVYSVEKAGVVELRELREYLKGV